eukprot:TRINITY_DN65798_c0_g1_i1.p1 TRINITY_DN65798_c0_g1~~TRINITY_DN65798_c0_g1_i1.p1  ORF type:complete len:355 (+),score=66.18 TRINITY_DN65798_c0_g1_i1:104-1168(+)
MADDAEGGAPPLPGSQGAGAPTSCGQEAAAEDALMALLASSRLGAAGAAVHLAGQIGLVHGFRRSRREAHSVGPAPSGWRRAAEPSQVLSSPPDVSSSSSSSSSSSTAQAPLAGSPTQPNVPFVPRPPVSREFGNGGRPRRPQRCRAAGERSCMAAPAAAGAADWSPHVAASVLNSQRLQGVVSERSRSAPPPPSVARAEEDEESARAKAKAVALLQKLFFEEMANGQDASGAAARALLRITERQCALGGHLAGESSASATERTGPAAPEVSQRGRADRHKGAEVISELTSEEGDGPACEAEFEEPAVASANEGARRTTAPQMVPVRPPQLLSAPEGRPRRPNPMVRYRVAVQN